MCYSWSPRILLINNVRTVEAGVCDQMHNILADNTGSAQWPRASIAPISNQRRFSCSRSLFHHWLHPICDVMSFALAEAESSGSSLPKRQIARGTSCQCKLHSINQWDSVEFCCLITDRPDDCVYCVYSAAGKATTMVR